jgi:hypothetical protein
VPPVPPNVFKVRSLVRSNPDFPRLVTLTEMMGIFDQNPEGSICACEVSKARSSCRSRLATQSNAPRPFSAKLLVQVLNRLCPEGFRY